MLLIRSLAMHVKRTRLRNKIHIWTKKATYQQNSRKRNQDKASCIWPHRGLFISILNLYQFYECSLPNLLRTALWKHVLFILLKIISGLDANTSWINSLYSYLPIVLPSILVSLFYNCSVIWGLTVSIVSDDHLILIIGIPISGNTVFTLRLGTFSL